MESTVLHELLTSNYICKLSNAPESPHGILLLNSFFSFKDQRYSFYETEKNNVLGTSFSHFLLLSTSKILGYYIQHGSKKTERWRVKGRQASRLEELQGSELFFWLHTSQT